MNVEMASMPKLPNGWAWVSLSEIATLIRGVSYPKEESSKEPKDGYIPILRANNIDRELNFNELVYVPSNRVNNEQFIRAFDVVVAMSSGSRDLVGKASQANRDFEGGFGAFCGLVRIIPELDRKFVGFFFQSPSYRSQVSRLSSGVNINNLRRSHIESMSIPLAPLPEQHRAVAKIEELYTKLDAGVEALNKIKAQVKRYRQAVLKHAFEGKLTAEWRQAHQHELELASALLEHIKHERQKAAKSKYKELPPVDTSDLPELPEGWVWSNFEELKKAERNSIKAGPFGSSLKKESYTSHGYKIYGQEQVIRQNPAYGNYYVGEEKYMELKSCAVKPGDILISLVGTIGKVLILPEDSEPGIINPRLVKLSLEERLVDNKYMKAYMESSAVRNFFTLASHGETMEILNLGILRTLPIPVPPLTEQQRIIEEIERRFSVADEIEKTVDHSLKQAERLRQSILKRAFGGKLVSQDPNDESAEKLLERVKVERAKRPSYRQE